MIGMSAVIFIPDDTAKTGYPQPLMLQSVMGAPLLAWLANALFDSGVGRFFLVCHDRYVEAARACLPAEAEVMTTMDSDPADLLHVFLSTAEDAEHTITVVTGPAVYLPQLAPQAAGRFPRVYGVSREELMQALDEHFSFARFLLDNGSPMNEEQAMYSVASPAELPEIAGLLQRNRLLALARTGVEIYDASSCYVEPSVRVAPGARPTLVLFWFSFGAQKRTSPPHFRNSGTPISKRGSPQNTQCTLQGRYNPAFRTAAP